MNARQTKKLFLALPVALLLSGCGTVDIQIPENGIQVELGTELPTDPSDYVTAKKYAEISVDLSEIDVQTVGSYTATILYKNKAAGAVAVSIVDTTAPEAVIPESITLENGSICSITDYITDITDLSETQIWFLIDSLQLQNEPEVPLNLTKTNMSQELCITENGDYQVNVLVQDIHGNYNVYPLNLSVFTPDVEIDEPPTSDTQNEGDVTCTAPSAEADAATVTESQTQTTNTVKSTGSTDVNNHATVDTPKSEATTEADSTSSVTSEQSTTSAEKPEATAPLTPAPGSDSGNAGNSAETTPPASEESKTTDTSEVSAGFDTGKASELLSLVNAEREARRLGTVTPKDSLTTKAKERAQSGNYSGSGVISCYGTGASSAAVVIENWKSDWPDGTWMTESWKYAGAACYTDGNSYTWIVVFGAY